MKDGFSPSELNYVIYFKKGKAGIGHIFTGELSRLDLARHWGKAQSLFENMNEVKKKFVAVTKKKFSQLHKGFIGY